MGLPLSVVVYDDDLDVWEPGAHAGTFRGNQLAMAAGRATIEHVLENDLHEHAAEMGRATSGPPRTDRREFDAVGDVRGRGLMLGVEIVDSDGEPERLGALPRRTADLARPSATECFDRGLIVETGGRHGSDGVGSSRRSSSRRTTGRRHRRQRSTKRLPRPRHARW